VVRAPPHDLSHPTALLFLFSLICRDFPLSNILRNSAEKLAVQSVLLRAVFLATRFIFNNL